MANSRFYSSVAQQTTLTSGVTSTGVTVIVASTSGFPGSTPYTLALDYGTATEELVDVTGVAGLTLTVTRAVDGTSGSAHNPGAVVRHVSSARDFTDSRTHEASTAAHGATGAVVGTTNTQTLTNKTLTRALGSLQNISMFNVGATGITQIIGDSTNPTASRLEIKDNEVALNTLVFFQSTGNIKSVKASGEANNIYRFRMTDNDGTTDRFALLAGGTVTISPVAGTTFVPMDLAIPTVDSTQKIVRVAAPGGGSERFTVFGDGHTAIAGMDATQTELKVTAAASQSADILQVKDSAANSLFVVQSTGVTVANKGAVIAQPGVTSGAVLQVGGSNLGYTGNLEQWVGPSNTIVAQVTEAGNLSANDVSWTGTAWNTYAVAWNGSTTNPVVGNGTLIGRYKQFGKTVIVHVNLTAGSTTTFGSGTSYSFTLPFTSANAGATVMGTAQTNITDRWAGQVQIGPNSTSMSVFFPISTTNTRVDFWSPTLPQTFANGSFVRCTITYEIA